jgi:hypothetical protein
MQHRRNIVKGGRVGLKINGGRCEEVGRRMA